jgi:hypothetical protein
MYNINELESAPMNNTLSLQIGRFFRDFRIFLMCDIGSATILIGASYA